jgi:hypothetical protein
VPRSVVALLVLLVLAAAAAGSAAARAPSLTRTAARTTGAGSARYTLNVTASFSGASIRTQSRGEISFRLHQAHVYKLVPGDPYPQEQIVDGPWTYTNANVAASLGDSRVRPWTKVDTRRLPAAQRIGELDHVRALAYLSAGAVPQRLLGTRGSLTHWRGSVDPTRVLAHVPAAQRAATRAILRADYAARAFPADFWLDDRSRLRRVRVSYTTGKGTSFTLVGTFSGFGTRVDVTPPPARSTRDITP